MWGGLGVTQALQYAFHEVWHVPYKDRPPFVVRLVRGLGVFALLAVGILASTLLALLGTFFGGSRAAGAVGILGAFGVTLGLYLAVFRMLSPRNLRLIELLPGAVVAAIGWQALQTFGLLLVTHQLRRSSQLYGTIGAVLGFLGFLLIGTQVLLYSLEVTVVRAQHLWPRSIVQPPLTESDIALLSAMAKQEERRPEERVTVTFDGATSEPAEPSPDESRSAVDLG